MAEHIWSILSTKAVIDRDSNLLSLFDVLEEVNFSGPGPSKYEAGNKVTIPLNYSLTTLWMRSDIKKPEIIKTRVSTLAPDKQCIFSQEVEIELKSNNRSRGIINFRIFIIKGPGIYKYKVDIETQKEKKKTWKNVANIPLLVNFLPKPN